jgi:hypothetical protein
MPDVENVPADLSSLRLDFANVADGFPILPAGEYPAICSNVEVGLSKTGNPKMDLTWDLDQGGKQWSTLSLQTQSLWRVKQTAIRIGITAEELNAASDVQALANLFKNRRGLLVVEVRQWDGEDRNGVKDIKSLDGSETTKSTRAKKGW